MLEIVIPETHKRLWDELKEEFVYVDFKRTKLQLEHSLISLKKWEQIWHKPFLATKDKTYDEIRSYIQCMTLNHGVEGVVYDWISKDQIGSIIKYIEDDMTATWFKEDGLIGAQKNSRQIITAEIIYYWMITLNIPVEFQKWHLNQLLTLIKVVSIKNGKEKKMDKRQAARERAALNAKRRAQFNSKG